MMCIKQYIHFEYIICIFYGITPIAINVLIIYSLLYISVYIFILLYKSVLLTCGNLQNMVIFHELYKVSRHIIYKYNHLNGIC